MIQKIPRSYLVNLYTRSSTFSFSSSASAGSEGNMSYDSVRKIWSKPARSEIIGDGLCLGEWILQKFDQLDPDRVVEVYYDSGEQCTVEELRKLAVSSARGLSALRVGKGDVVVFFSQLNKQVGPIALGCFLIGAAIHTVEVKFNDDDSDCILKDVNPTIIVYDHRLQDRVTGTVQRLSLPKLKHVIPFGSGDNSVEQLLFNDTKNIEQYKAPHLGNPDSLLAVVLLTSGSTGLPKIMQLSQTQYVFGHYNWADVNSTDILYSASPMRWITQVSSILLPLSSGCTRVLSAREPSAETCTEIIKRTKATMFLAVSSVYYSMVLNAEDSASVGFESLRLVITGGEVVMEDMIARSQKLLPKCAVQKSFGMSEMGGLISADNSVAPKNGGPLRQGVSLRIVDENGVALAPKELGQIHIRVEFPLIGYLNNDAANKESFLPDGWYSSGDFGYMDDEGHLNVLGRYKDMIYCDGQLIIPSKIEQILSKCPLVQTSAVIAVPHEKPGKGEKPAVFVKLNGDIDSNSADEILQFLLSRLEADIPLKGLHCVEKFPLTTCGKTDKVQLKQLAESVFNDIVI